MILGASIFTLDLILRLQRFLSTAPPTFLLAITAKPGLFSVFSLITNIKNRFENDCPSFRIAVISNEFRRTASLSEEAIAAVISPILTSELALRGYSRFLQVRGDHGDDGASRPLVHQM
jgi:hypothetical protein